ncbi:glutathione synthase [Candidatus Macondimonas diazotrophica]|jgi:glutathione synthase|uniref:Glutathione synthetase n=1 Tax=Candidatus Macondimonas diazotrophica TaxID=2305248 RepID=A0A4Z0FAW9_9GAMM|nr:glutathione synthase [Candidatus Macondimonas diazotrophica]NCU01424.1 glutathione synthase [Candidatus Macondimonas diazotrophica]TFZ83623.1 glutathione synthase [Candidatus Macondimonas diazotrophica]HBG30268.1 glutathione synthase [Gammaproteobacteria bacterium]
MSLRIGVVMDPIATIKPVKDTTLALLLEAQRRGWSILYMELGDLYLADGTPWAHQRPLTVQDSTQNWFHLAPGNDVPLGELDVILMRKDPPFNMEYIYATYILERAQLAGTLVVNRPESLRDVSEKAYTAWFADCCPPTVIARDMARLRRFVVDQGEVIVKPLDGMGGASIFRTRHDDPNLSVILETLTDHGRRFAMAQRYLPAIKDGDKRILVVDGQPVPYALARIPAAGEARGNLAAGGRGEGRPLTDRDYWICEQVGPMLRKKGLLFVGLDVIGDSLTEINVTSPTCVRELDRQYGLNIAGLLMDAIERRLGESAAIAAP